MMVGVMVLSFTLLSTAFMLLSYRYIISEKRDAMARNASYIATFTASYYQQYDSCLLYTSLCRVLCPRGRRMQSLSIRGEEALLWS